MLEVVLLSGPASYWILFNGRKMKGTVLEPSIQQSIQRLGDWGGTITAA